MYKIIKYITFIFFFFSIVNAEDINKIEITGNKRISNEAIIVLGNFSVSKKYDLEDLNNSLKSLYESNFFSDIDISFVDGTLLIDVVENPIIDNLELNGIKNEKFLELILDNIKLKPRMSFSENLLKRDIDLISNILKTSGYYFSKIDTSTIKNDELNSINITINIDQGNKAKIKKIIFIGDKKIKDKKLLNVIASEEHKFWKFISNKVYLNKSVIDLDKRLLENYYKNLGYYKVDIIDSFAEFTNEEYFKLSFNIDSGNKYYFGTFNLNLPENYNFDDFRSIQQIFKKLKGKNYSLDNFNLILSEIDRIASFRLYDFINVEVNEIIVDDRINFTFNVVDSEKFYVERINIIGNYTTIEEVVRNRLIVDEGDPFNTLLFNKSIDNIRSLGIFKSVDFKVKESENQNLKIIDILVDEKPTGEISLGAGVGTSGSTIAAGLVEKNFLGKGINLDTNLEISESSIEGKFVYSRPNFAYTDNTLFTSLNSSTTDNLSDFGYKISDLSFSLGTRFEYFENLFFSPEIDLSLEELKTNTTASSTLKKQDGTYEDLYFNYGLDYDLRNSSYNPTSGYRTFFSQQVPIVSANNEISNTFILTKYKTLSQTSELVGRGSLYIKSVNSLDSSDVRISKRPNVPYNRLRGFERGKVGPLDNNNDYIGGNYVTTLNLSTTLPNLLTSLENFDFFYFVDIANVWGVDYDSSIDDSNYIRSSTGLGVDLITPIGPLSFSLSQNLSKKSTDKTETFRFNLGTTF
jgi:outer membrane protein insertion porin family